VITSSTRLRALEPVAVDRPVDLAPAPGRDAPSVGSQDHLVLRTILLVCGAVFLVMYVVIAVARWRYPYELEWMEGGVLTHVQRVLHGQSLYGASSVRFTPFIYTPLYYYASAAAAWVIGPSLSTLRLVSILGSLLALGAVYRLVAAETKARWPGVVGACLLAACFRVAGAWLDLARVDALFLGLLLAALVCVRGSESWRRALAAGALFGAAFLTKQEALLPALAVLPFLWRRGPRIAASYLGSMTTVVAVPTIVLQYVSNGWYLQYTLWLPMQHDLAGEKVLGFWTGDIARTVGLAAVVGVAALIGLLGESRRFYVPVVVALVLASYTARLHTGGYDNVLLPAYAGIAVAFGIGCHVLTHSPERLRCLARLVFVAAIAQFALLAYNPLAQIPGSADVRAGDRFVADLRQLPGPVYLPGSGWLLERLGQSPTAHAGAVGDILRGHAQGSNLRFVRDLRHLVAEHKFGAIVVESPRQYSYLPRNIARYYCIAGRIPRHDFPRPLTGTQVVPATVWMPRTGNDPVARADRC
jgi:Glycosyltransferase family 87